eukprot:CAMPEP_0174853630 /NCGR_PEP_ID=MMETSP1114-20130205/29228_1 /TAXON_ID=312471 /ORGANISM="Neobodo designis, Strain CCAP 1951/1" /LENGTH=142 /DNA_ID=CAMNT_0016088287 /DNA_START=33 /DNA_END=461 /DNA_ORIENTATION=+
MFRVRGALRAASTSAFAVFLQHHEATFPRAPDEGRLPLLQRMFDALPAAERRRFEQRAAGEPPQKDAEGSDGTMDRQRPIDRSQLLAVPAQVSQATVDSDGLGGRVGATATIGNAAESIDLAAVPSSVRRRESELSAVDDRN